VSHLTKFRLRAIGRDFRGDCGVPAVGATGSVECSLGNVGGERGLMYRDERLQNIEGCEPDLAFRCGGNKRRMLRTRRWLGKSSFLNLLVHPCFLASDLFKKLRYFRTVREGHQLSRPRLQSPLSCSF
jgi:hypothetical protein